MNAHVLAYHKAVRVYNKILNESPYLEDLGRGDIFNIIERSIHLIVQGVDNDIVITNEDLSEAFEKAMILGVPLIYAYIKALSQIRNKTYEQSIIEIIKLMETDAPPNYS